MCKLLCQLSEFAFETEIRGSQRTLSGDETGKIIENFGQVEKAMVKASYRGESCVLGDFVADVIAYLLSYENNHSEAIEYNKRFEMDHCRLLCLLFLTDWRSTLLDNDTHETLTQGIWCRGIEGPYLQNILRMAKDSCLMTEIFKYDIACPVRLAFSAMRENNTPALDPLTDDQMKVIRHTVDVFRDTTPDRLIALVYATDPLIDAEMHKPIDISMFAARHVRLYGQLNI